MRLLLPAFYALALSAQPTFFRDEEVRVVGQLQYGQTTEPFDYAKHDLAVHFEGSPGDRVDIKIDSTDGQAMAALTDSHYKPIVSNFGSHVTAVLPPSADPYPHEYYVIFREVRRKPAAFRVSVQKVGENGAAARAEYLTCTADAECVAVAREGCCHNGYKDAVNKDKIADYRAANACRVPNTLCPQFRVVDRRVAECSYTTRQCEMVEPETIRCGGTGDAAHECPAGYACKTTGTSIPGICARQ